MEEDIDSSMDEGLPPPERKEGNRKCFHLFNCDKTYKLDVVENLLNAIKGELGFDITISTKKYFRLFEMSELCETVKSGPPMDFAVFVVHANESRLSINEENAGIGYARFYRTLLQAAGERVLVVIGGDNNYKNAAEEESAVLSRWAKRQISSQFREEFMDGQKSFIFSWDKKHRSIHEEALLHFLDSAKTGTKFVHNPKRQQTTPSVDTNQLAKSEKSDEVDVTAKKEVSSSNVQPMKDEHWGKAETGRVQENAPVYQPPDKNKPNLGERVDVIHEGAREQYPAFLPESACIKQLGAMAKGTLPQEKKGAILCRDQSDTAIIRDLFGDELLAKFFIFSGCPDAGPKSLLLSSIPSLRSCFIVVDAKTLEDELHHRSVGTPYEDLLTAFRGAVETKVAIIICSDRSMASPNEETAITNRINLILGDKGIILWWKENKSSHLETKIPRRASQLNRSLSLPDSGAAKMSTGFNAHRVNPEASSLRLKTRLRHGTISYRHGDVEKRLEGWTPPKEIVDDLMKKWKSTADAELLIYRENETGRDLVVVNEVPKTTQVTDSLKDVLHNITPGASCLHAFTGKSRASSSSNDMDLD